MLNWASGIWVYKDENKSFGHKTGHDGSQGQNQKANPKEQLTY